MQRLIYLSFCLVFTLGFVGQSASGVITEPQANEQIVIGTNIETETTMYGSPPPGNVYMVGFHEFYISSNGANWRELENFDPINGDEWNDISPNTSFYLMYKERWANDHGVFFEYENFVGGPYLAILDTPVISSLSNNGSWTINDPVTVAWTTRGSYRIAYFQIIGRFSNGTEVELSNNIDPAARTYTWNLPEFAIGVDNIFVKCTWDAHNPYVSTSSVVPVEIAPPGPVTISGNTYSIGHMGMHLGSSGVNIYANGNVVATTDNAGNYSLEVPWNWSGMLTAGMSFFTFNPVTIPFNNVRANVTGINFQRNWVGPTYDSVSFVPAGNGKSYWAICPAGDMPGHPDITFKYNFANNTMYTDLPTGSLRLRLWPFDPDQEIIEIYNDAPVVAENGYTADFHTLHPALDVNLNDCGRMMLYGQLQIYVEDSGAYGDPQWVSTTTPPYLPFTGFSRLDLFQNGKIDLADISAFQASYGKCQGQTGYSHCANFVPTETDNCVDSADLGLFAAHYGHPVTKDNQDIGINDNYLIEFRPTDQDSIMQVVLISYTTGWSSFAARINITESCNDLDFFWESNDNESFVTLMAKDSEGDNNGAVLIGISEGLVSRSEAILGSMHIIGAQRDSINATASAFSIMSLEVSSETIGSEQTPASNPRVDRLKISQVSRNPFCGEFSMRVETPHNHKMSARVYDIRGRLVRELVYSAVGENTGEVVWDGRSNSGLAVAGGVYFINVVSGPETATEKVLILK